MSSPMFDLPDHSKIGVNNKGQGPAMETDPDFDHYECWCGNPTCFLYKEN